MRYDLELWVIHIVWTAESKVGPTHVSPWIGPIVGRTRTDNVMKLVRGRLKANNHPFVRVEKALVRRPQWLFGLDCMQDSVDRMLDDVFSSTEGAVEL